MKKLLLLLLTAVSSITLYAQSLSNSNLTINPSPFSNTVLVANLSVTNNTSSDKNIICERTVNNLAVNPAYPTEHDSGHLSSFCWDQCYPEWISVSSFPITITANSTDDTHFIGDLETHGIVGTSNVTYSFYVEGNPNDQTSITINYNYATGISNVSADKSGLSSARPNPADAFTTVSYSLTGNPSKYKIEIVSMLGKKFAQYGLPGKNGVMTIPTNELSSGVYFYVLKENDKTISSQKLVVSHK
jgi:hypothetical protein